MNPSDPVASGGYARKQLYCPSRVVAWSHGSRFRRAIALAARGRGGRLLDYGCGDGTFLALTHGMFREAVGADVDRAQLDDCRRRLGHLEGVHFVETAALHAGGREPFDVITCMEVLEHCTDEQRHHVLGDLARLCAPAGTIVISVPIEVGPALLGKQLFRAVAAWRRQGDYQYRETYTAGELLSAALGRPVTRAEYAVQTAAGEHRYRGHKGFDWRMLETELRTRFEVDQRLFTPMPILRGLLNSQVWFVCRRRR